MAGIYLHIPFCKRACHYCDFHFSTQLDQKSELLQALTLEIQLRKNYLGGQGVRTVYFGGGTPSLLSGDDIKRLLDTIQQHYNLDVQAEITLEANPDDLNKEKIRDLRSTPINRLSVGVQSFFDEDLKWMNRSHTGMQANDSIKRLQDAGIDNITADLIYGYPLLSDHKWKANLDQIIQLQVPHISAYSMTVEDKTALATFIRKGKEKPMNETQSAKQYALLCTQLKASGFKQYEISNFARKGMISQHNSNYWKGESYLGAGPSAHSFNGDSRQWNISNNATYIRSLLVHEQVPFEKEGLDAKTRANELIMTGLRTKWGLNLQKIEKLMGPENRIKLQREAAFFLKQGQMRLQNDHLLLNHSGKLYADQIAARLFF